MAPIRPGAPLPRAQRGARWRPAAGRAPRSTRWAQKGTTPSPAAPARLRFCRPHLQRPTSDDQQVFSAHAHMRDSVPCHDTWERLFGKQSAQIRLCPTHALISGPAGRLASWPHSMALRGQRTANCVLQRCSGRRAAAALAIGALRCVLMPRRPPRRARGVYGCATARYTHTPGKQGQAPKCMLNQKALQSRVNFCASPV